jgi:hypothetical protein
MPLKKVYLFGGSPFLGDFFILNNKTEFYEIFIKKILVPIKLVMKND